MNNDLKNYQNKLNKALNTVDQIYIEELYAEILKRINNNGVIYLFGNGGSLANCDHIVGDFRKTIIFGKNTINIQNIGGNSCYLSAASNDLDYSEVYSVLVEKLITKKDLIIFLSGSGNSCNLIKCAKKAFRKKIKQVSISAYNGGELKRIVDIPIHINFPDMEIAEDCQMIIFHNIKQRLVKDLIDDEYVNMNKYKKRINEDLIA